MRRREALGLIAGLPGLACTARVDGRAIAGAVVGGNHGLGHRLRGGFRPAPARFEETGVAILGGGIAGLSAAWALERAGYRDYVILELESEPGGTARSGTGPVTPYPWAAHYVPVPATSNRPLVALLEEVGAVEDWDARGEPVWAEAVLCRDPQERVFFRGDWYEGLYPRIGATAEDVKQLHAFEDDMRAWTGFRDAKGRRAFDLPRARCSDAPRVRELDGISMAEYVRRKGWTSPRLRWFVEYGCRDDFGSTLEQTSAWAGIHYFAARLPEAEAAAAEFLTWPEGNGRLVAHLARIAGARLRTNALVTAVRPLADRVEVCGFDANAARPIGLRARHAVFALPRFLAAPLIEPWRERPPAHLRETTYGCWMVANLTLSDRPETRGYPLAWDNVLYDSPSLGYVVATHQSGRDHGPTVWTYYTALLDDDPRVARARLLDTSFDAWVEQILADLGPAHPDLRRLVERIDVYLWGHAMVRPRPGFLWGAALAESSRPLGRLRFAHTDLSGMALFEEAQYWGIRAAESILRDLAHPHESWLG